MVIVIMGVMGSGKTTVGRRLAELLGWRFVDADTFHPSANVEKLRRGAPLTDQDRAPWLEELRRRIASWVASGEHVVLACSALKREYRRTLLDGHREPVRLVYLKGTAEVLGRRLVRRSDHFAAGSLLASQLGALEEPADALTLEADAPVEDLVRRIRAGLGL